MSVMELKNTSMTCLSSVMAQKGIAITQEDHIKVHWVLL